jgi:hypothetical protein
MAVKGLTARVAAETTLRLVANNKGLEVELLSRRRARSVMGIGQKGTLADELKSSMPKAVGKYWNDRRFAAFAALAHEKAASC